MTAYELRQLNSNFRLAWMIGEDRLPISEVKKFTLSELNSVLAIASEEMREEIRRCMMEGDYHNSEYHPA